MNGLQNLNSIISRKHINIYQTNPIGVSRKQFNKFVSHQGLASRKELFRRLDLEELQPAGSDNFDQKKQ